MGIQSFVSKKLKSERISTFLERIAALFAFQNIVGVSSFIISIVAVVFTYEQNSLDRYYREALVKPDLVLSISDTSDAISVRNDGLGPALIAWVSVFDKERAIEEKLHIVYTPPRDAPITKLPSEAETHRAFLFNVSALFQAALSDGVTLGTPKNGGLIMQNVVKTPNYSIATLQSNQSKELISFDRKALLAYLEENKDFVGEYYDTLSARSFSPAETFLDKAAISICYCSVTRRTCSQADSAPGLPKCEGLRQVEYSSIFERMASLFSR